MTTEEKELKKIQIAAAQIIKAAMTTEEKIEFVNTPYSQMPEELKPGMVKNPQMFNFVRVTHKNIGPQKETFAARLIRYRDKYHLSPSQFCDLCNDFAKKYDMAATATHKAQKTRITLRDVDNYENFNVCPKIDKMTIIAEATQISIDYFGGYGAQNRRSKNETMEARRRSA